jgi:catechol 2,3-dioxygenase-like lactoylglutathione lyase family enzyme
VSARFISIAPTVPVRDLDRALAFYVDRIGFAVTFRSPVFALIQRDGQNLGLQRDFAGNRAGSARFYVWTTAIDGLHADLLAKRTECLGDLAMREHGLRDFTLADPDGNEFGVGEAAS